MGAKRCGPLKPRLVSGLTLMLGLAATAPDQALESSIGHLRTVVYPLGNTNHLDMISSLRQLRDPSLPALQRCG